MIPWIERDQPFPPVETALREPDGLLCAGADLSLPRLVAAYRSGIFPWFSEGEPILWWSPDPRMALRCDDLRISRSLAKSMRNRGYAVKSDTAFAATLDGCAAPRDGQRGTWLVPAMRAAYRGLHEAGFAHSIETWRDGELVGGLYGVAIGRMFYGESMFSRATDASKVALVALVGELRRRRMPLIDCQMHTPLLASMGAREMPRARFLHEVRGLVNYPQPSGKWMIGQDECPG